MSRKTEKIFVAYGNRKRIIGYKVGFNSSQQIKRFTGGGCIIPGIICFYYDRPKECVDTFYFEDGKITYMTVQIVTEPYLCSIYNKCVIDECDENELIKRILSAYAPNNI